MCITCKYIVFVVMRTTLVVVYLVCSQRHISRAASVNVAALINSSFTD